MKRYFIFAGNTYYPSGGMHDYQTSFDKMDEVWDWINDNQEQDWPFDWWHVYDSVERKIVTSSHQADIFSNLPKLSQI